MHKMKKRSKIVLLLSAFLVSGLILYFVGFLAPYNLQGALNANSFGIQNMDSFKEIDELSQYFKNYNVTQVKYLGSDSYEVFTDKGTFIAVADYSGTLYWKYKIFKYDKELQYFTNPM